MSETRFTERAQAALRLAQECSAELGHGYVGSEHLLLGLAREGKGVAAKVLQSAGLEPESLKAAIARMVGVGAPGGAPSQGLTPRCKKIIELSLTEAARLGHHYVGTEHLLLGILREGDGVAVRVLSGTGVELAGARQNMIIAARAAGVQCFDTVFTNLDDMEGFEREVRMIKMMGFDGKSLVNPRQIEIVHKIFTPTRKEIIFAEKVVREIDEKKAQGIGVFTVDGKMIDIAFYDGAMRTLRLAKASGVYEGDL